MNKNELIQELKAKCEIHQINIGGIVYDMMKVSQIEKYIPDTTPTPSAVTEEEIKAIAEKLYPNYLIDNKDDIQYTAFITGYKSATARDRQEWVELVTKMQDYIVLLGKELDELAVMAANRGWKSTRIEAGQKIRKEIAEIEAKLLFNKSEPTPQTKSTKK